MHLSVSWIMSNLSYLPTAEVRHLGCSGFGALSARPPLVQGADATMKNDGGIELYTATITLWLFNIAMENRPFIDGLPIKHGNFPWLC